jgi:hypothetical protein
MRRVLAVSALVIGVLTAVSAVSAAGTAASAAGTAVSAAGSGSCPARDDGVAAGHPPVSSRPGARTKLVPAGAVSVLLCRYSGLTEPAPLSIPAPQFTLWAQRLIATPTTAAALASALNSIPPTKPGVAYSCPAGFDQYVVAYFGYGSGPPNPVTLDVNECNTVTNGLVHRVGLSGSAVRQVFSLIPAPRPGSVRIELRVCGGPAPGGCRIEAFGSCGGAPGSCISSDRAAIVAADGATVATLRLHEGRTGRLALIPARYTFRLLGDGRGVSGRVLGTQQATVRPGVASTITFMIAVP